MRHKLTSLWLLLVLLAPAGLGAQTEIPGTVTGVDDRDVTIRIPGDLLPRRGDEVRLRFRDPVEGVGLVFLEGTWEVSVVRRDEVVAVPKGQTVQPQEELVALISSVNPQAKADFREAAAPIARPAMEEEPAVAAVVRDPGNSDVTRIDRRRWVTISAGAGAVAMQTPAFFDYEPDSDIAPRITASAGIFVLPNLSVGGFLGAASVEGTNGTSTNSAQEIYKVLGATLYSGKPGNVPGDVHPFIQGGYAWYDIHYGGGGSDPDVTGTGVFGGGGFLYTIKRTFGIYVAGHVLTSSFDENHVVFDRIQAEINAGATVIF